MDVRSQVLKAFPDRTEGRKGPEQRKVGGPDVRRDEDSFRAGLQGNFKQIAAVQSEDRPPVRMDVADCFKPVGELLRRFKPRQQNQAVYLAGPAVFLVDGADLSGDHKTGRLPGGRRVLDSRSGAQTVKPVLRRDELFPELRAPCGMGEIPGPHKADALAPGPEIKRFRFAVLRGGEGIFGVNVQVGKQHDNSPVFKRIC